MNYPDEGLQEDYPVYKDLWFFSLEEALESLSLGTIVTRRTVTGGDINDAQVIGTNKGQQFFLKEHSSPGIRHFGGEFDGLVNLVRHLESLPQERRFLTCPRPLAMGTGTRGSWLLMEYVPPFPGSPRGEQWFCAGQGLGYFHAERIFGYYGHGVQNCIGSTIQRNVPSKSWAVFFRTQRLEPQIAMANKRGFISSRLNQELEKILTLCQEMLPDDPGSSLVHGDLWRGNMMFDQDGRGVLIDPAVYRGHWETDIAMTRLFGGFPQDFYRGYHEIQPREAGESRRQSLYNLYHILNHCNLFGSGYVSQVQSLAGQILS